MSKETNEDFELTLFDRLEVIRSVLQDVPDDKGYISFSGGKDSTVLSHMIDEAIPNNRYDRVFSNTGIEYNAIVDFVQREREIIASRLFLPDEISGKCWKMTVIRSNPKSMLVTLLSISIRV